jgi:hypothetical protein
MPQRLHNSFCADALQVFVASLTILFNLPNHSTTNSLCPLKFQVSAAGGRLIRERRRVAKILLILGKSHEQKIDEMHFEFQHDLILHFLSFQLWFLHSAGFHTVC